jgi:hypothetical protein
MFTNQFVQFTDRVKRMNQQSKAELMQDPIVVQRFEENSEFLRYGDINEPLDFPNEFQKKYPFQIREVFEYIKPNLKKRELVAFEHGKLFSEKLINMYFKILEKMNLVQLSMDNYQR